LNTDDDDVLSVSYKTIEKNVIKKWKVTFENNNSTPSNENSNLKKKNLTNYIGGAILIQFHALWLTCTKMLTFVETISTFDL
jgi:NAD+--asparagine ADP-ribosyltransferase